MRYNLSEKKVLKKLGIEDFRHMTKDKIVQFASMLPQMDPEVAKKALEQFPEFKDMAIEVVKNLQQSIEIGIDSADRSQDQFYLACNKVIDLLNDQLNKDGITDEKESEIRDNIMQVVSFMAEKDSEHKAFIQSTIKTICASAAIIVLAATSLLGTNIGGFGELIDRHRDDL